jgi:hypothetical protein
MKIYEDGNATILQTSKLVQNWYSLGCLVKL